MRHEQKKKTPRKEEEEEEKKETIVMPCLLFLSFVLLTCRIVSICSRL